MHKLCCCDKHIWIISSQLWFTESAKHDDKEIQKVWEHAGEFIQIALQI